MQELPMVKTFIAEASELQSSDLYMTVKATLFTIPEANLNGVRCTAEFLEEIVENQDKYVGLPLCADVRNLELGQYQKLGHCYNPTTGKFSTSIIGSFYKFEKEATENGTALIGYARVMKRNKAVCAALAELFAEGALKFSFEISCGEYRKLDDGTIEIGRSDSNFIEGMCVVSFPACPQAVAMQLVAELAGSLEKEADDMPNELEKVLSEEDNTEAAVAETAVAETVEATAAEAVSEETAVETEQKDETAAVIVRTTEVQVEEVNAYDTETGAETNQRVTVETNTVDVIDGPTEATVAAETADSEPVVAENADDPDESEDKEDEAEDKPEDEKSEEQTAEVSSQEPELDVRVEIKAAVEEAVSELRETIAQLTAEIAAIKEAGKADIVAEVLPEIGTEVNPLIGELSDKKYSLLERANKSDTSNGYSLLERM